MNEAIILAMARPYVDRDKMTYEDFDKVFSILSLRERYGVTSVLFQHGIELVDRGEEEDVSIPDAEDDEPAEGSGDEPFEALREDAALFQDRGGGACGQRELILRKTVHQSNEVLCSLIQQGDRQAAQDLCVKNKGLVDKYALAFERRSRDRLDLEDLEQVGALGLIKAAQRFDIHQGTAFSTYAVYWIKQSILREIMENGYVIRIPVHLMEKINKVAALYDRASWEDASHQEKIRRIAAELDSPEDEVRECLRMKTGLLGCTSLDVPVGQEGDTELGELIPVEEEASVEQIVLNGALRQELETVLATLKPREEDVLKLRVGWDDGRPKTLDEIGSKYHVTRERIRQIEAKAIRKLQHPTRSWRLKIFWEE